MGSWNGTCMVSNLPILYGEKVKLVLLYNTQALYNDDYTSSSVLNKSSFCEMNGMLIPAYLPIEGEYDDSGCIDNIVKDFNYEVVEKSLKAKFKSSIKINETILENWELKDILNHIERGNEHYAPMYLSKDDKWLNFDLSFIMIREDIYDSIAEDNKKNDTIDWRLGSVAISGKYALTFETEIIDLKNKLKAHLSEDKEEIKKYMMSSFSKHDSYSIYKSNNENFIDKNSYINYLYSIITDENKIKDFYNKWLNFRIVEYFLSSIRKSWIIQAGAGSQDDDWDLYKQLSETIIKVCNDKINQEDWD